MNNKKSLIVSCPNCQGHFDYYLVDTRPFCSSSCQDRDFLRWTQEEHRIPTKETLSEADLEVVVSALREQKNHDDLS